MLNELNNIVTFLNNYIWGIGMLVLVVGSGLYFTIRLHGFQFVHFKDMWSRIIDKQDSDSGISAFGSFCTTMAMRVGTGNVAGVAVAIYMGGPGALFWMILAGMTNSAVCFAECTLSVLYKTRIDGQYRGGGAYCAERGLGLWGILLPAEKKTCFGGGRLAIPCGGQRGKRPALGNPSSPGKSGTMGFSGPLAVSSSTIEARVDTSSGVSPICLSLIHI